jgi:hypothetical protein
MDLQIKQWRSVMIVDDIIFSDENMFDLQQQFNVQNDKVWSVSLRDVVNHSMIPKCVSSHGLGRQFQKPGHFTGKSIFASSKTELHHITQQTVERRKSARLYSQS